MKDLIKRGLKEDAILEGNRTEKVPEIADEIMKFSVASEKSGAFNLDDYDIEDLLKLSDAEFQKLYDALGIDLTIDDDILLEDDFDIEDIAEEDLKNYEIV
jgi:hypothetical protein